MAFVWKRTAPHLKETADAHNSIRLQIGAGSHPHLDAGEEIIAAANPASSSDLAGCLVLVNNIRAIYAFHMADTLTHKVADTVDVTALAPAVDQTTVIALMLALALAYETHRASTTYHYNADSTNALASTTVTTLAQAVSVSEDFKTKFNAHIIAAPAGNSVRLLTA